MSDFFPYALDWRYAPVFVGLGLRPQRHGVTLSDDGRFRATYGPFGIDTPMSNVTGAHVTRDYRWWTSVGVRASFADDGLTFGTNSRQGVCVHFDDRVRRVIGFQPHSALTVTVDDVDGLVRAIEDRVS